MLVKMLRLKIYEEEEHDFQPAADEEDEERGRRVRTNRRNPIYDSFRKIDAAI